MEHKEPVIRGVCCDVRNCVHNDGCCTADSIHVNRCSDDPGKTKCDTFAEI